MYVLKYKRLNTKGFPEKTIITRNESCGNTTKVLIFRDSYAKALVQFLSLHFYEVFYIPESYKDTFVEELQPDIVISAPFEWYLDEM